MRDGPEIYKRFCAFFGQEFFDVYSDVGDGIKVFFEDLNAKDRTELLAVLKDKAENENSGTLNGEWRRNGSELIIHRRKLNDFFRIIVEFVESDYKHPK
jgi:hypothetical protein